MILFRNALEMLQRGVCDSFDCDSGLNNVVIPNCGDIDFGQKLVKIFVARPDAEDFADTTDLANQTTWETRVGYSPSDPTNGINRIVVVGDIHEGLKPAAEAETEEAPYGGDELVSRKHTVTFAIKRWNTALITSINELRCRDQYKVWLLTNTGWLFGGITGYENSSLNLGGLEFNGIGNGKSKSTNTISWYEIDDSVPVQALFLKTLQN